MSTQARFTPEELKQKLLDYHRAAASVVTDEELSDILDETSVRRYATGDKLLGEVQETLRTMAAALPDGADRNATVLAISKIDEAANEIIYGAMSLNKSMPFVKPTLHHVD